MILNWIKGLWMSSLLLAYLIWNIFRRTQPSLLHPSTFHSTFKFAHGSIYTHGWQFTGWYLAFIFKSLQFIVEAERILLYLHEQQWVSFVLLAGSLSVSLSHRMPMSSASGALADSLAFWLRRNQSGHQLPPTSYYPPGLATRQSPPHLTSIFSLTWCCYVIRIWSIQVWTSTNNHTASFLISCCIGFLMQQ